MGRSLSIACCGALGLAVAQGLDVAIAKALSSPPSAGRKLGEPIGEELAGILPCGGTRNKRCIPAQLLNTPQMMARFEDGLWNFWRKAIGTYMVSAAVAGMALMRISSHSGQKAAKAAILGGGVFHDDEEEDAEEERMLQDAETEMLWAKEAHVQGMRQGSFILSALMQLLILYRFYLTLTTDDCEMLVRFPGQVTVEFVFLGLLLSMSVVCFKFRPRSCLYWPSLLGFSFYMPAILLPPFWRSCTELQFHCAPRGVHLVGLWYTDCSLSGVSPTLILMTWILLLPWVIPSRSHMHLMWLWISGTYLAWSVLYMNIVENVAFQTQSVASRFFVISITLIASQRKKHHLDRAQRKRFFYDRAKKTESDRVFRLFQYMVPDHVIRPMLEGKKIADKVDLVSILFIWIDDFDELTADCTPQEVLEFLNRAFTGMDEICKKYDVTKVETVGEEYVACVGAVPDDIDEAKDIGHSGILERLFRAADDILRLQEDLEPPLGAVPDGPQIRFRMGMHTGDIVAGVIGEKLPRYRLFGDTINTAARMMQRGEKGKLTFGRETHAYIPDTVKATHKGLVDMKGKGQVEVFRFDGMADRSYGWSKTPDALESRECGTRRSLVAELLDPDIIVPPPRMPSERPREQSRERSPERSQPVSRSASRSRRERRRRRAKHDQEHNPFDEILTKAAGFEDRQSLLSYVRLLLGYMSEAERQYQEHYFDSTFSKKASVRLRRSALLLFVLAASSQMLVMQPPGGGQRDTGELGARQTMWRVLAVIWFSVVPWLLLKWHKELKGSPIFVQCGFLVCDCIAIFSLYVSFDLLVDEDEIGDDSELALRLPPSPDNQLNSFVFVLTCGIIWQRDPFMFWPSVAFIWMALFLATVLFGHFGFGTMFFSRSGKIVFVVNAVLNSLFAREAEHMSRTRFRANQAQDERRRRTTEILDTLMPPLVVPSLCKLAKSAPWPSHQYRRATIAQSDLCGFTKLASGRPPTDVISFMGELFGAFDELTKRYNIYKVETIGDAYIAGCAEAPLTSENVPVNVVLFGLDMITAVKHWSDKLGEEPVSCRVGIQHGECIGGLVGIEMQRYHLFGRLVKELDILESTGREGMLQVSTACKEAVENSMEEEGIQDIEFEMREGESLFTSKGERHSFDEVGGRTYFVRRLERQRSGSNINARRCGRIGLAATLSRWYNSRQT